MLFASKAIQLPRLASLRNSILMSLSRSFAWRFLSFVSKSLVEDEMRPDESRVSTSPKGVFMAVSSLLKYFFQLMTTYFHAGALCFFGTKKEMNLLQRCSMEKFPRMGTTERFVYIIM